MFTYNAITLRKLHRGARCSVYMYQCIGWSGVVVSALASINKVILRWAQLVLRWVTMLEFNSRCRTFILVCNQPATKANSAFHPSSIGKWVPASTGKAKAGMVHSVSRWMWGVQVKLWDPLRTCAIRERLRGVFMSRHYTNPHLPYLILHNKCSCFYIKYCTVRYCNLWVTGTASM